MTHQHETSSTEPAVVDMTPTPTTRPAASFMEKAVSGIIIIGSKKSVLEHLNERFPMKKKGEPPATERYFYSTLSFEEQIEKLVKFNKYKNAEYLFGVLFFFEHTPEPLPEMIANIPAEYRDYRIIRVELHK